MEMPNGVLWQSGLERLLDLTARSPPEAYCGICQQAVGVLNRKGYNESNKQPVLLVKEPGSPNTRTWHKLIR